MSKYGKYIIGVLLGVVLIVAVWQIVLSRNGDDKPSLAYPENIQEKVDIFSHLDQEVYFSNDMAQLEIKISSNSDSGKLMVLIEGMKNDFGVNYFNEKKIIKLSKDAEETIKIEKQLPQCSSCSGFFEGKYEIQASVLRGSYVLAKDIIGFTLKP